MVSVLWLYLKSLQTTLPPQEGWDCKRLGAFKPRQSSSDKRMELEVMALEGIVQIMGDKHNTGNSVRRDCGGDSSRPSEAHEAFACVGTVATGLTSTLAGVKELDRETTFPHIWVILSSSIFHSFISLAFDLSPPPAKLSLFPSFLLFGCSFSHSCQG